MDDRDFEIARISYRVKKLREGLSLSQVEFARRLGVTSAHISKIESKKTMPSQSLIKLICKEFEISEHWLTGDYVDDETPDYDLQEEVDMTMQRSTDITNLMLATSKPELKLSFARLESTFADIIDIKKIDKKNNIEYIKLCEVLFKDIYRYIEAMRTLTIDGVISLETLNQEAFYENFTLPIEKDLNDISNFFIKSSKFDIS